MSLGGTEAKIEFLESIEILKKLSYKIYTTEGTHKVFKKHGLKTKLIERLDQNGRKNALTLLESGKIDLVINTPSETDVKQEESDGYLLRRTAVDK